MSSQTYIQQHARCHKTLEVFYIFIFIFPYFSIPSEIWAHCVSHVLARTGSPPVSGSLGARIACLSQHDPEVFLLKSRKPPALTYAESWSLANSETQRDKKTELDTERKTDEDSSIRTGEDKTT
jgi:hypothetical protein